MFCFGLLASVIAYFQERNVYASYVHKAPKHIKLQDDVSEGGNSVTPKPRPIPTLKRQRNARGFGMVQHHKHMMLDLNMIFPQSHDFILDHITLLPLSQQEEFFEDLEALKFDARKDEISQKAISYRDREDSQNSPDVGSGKFKQHLGPPRIPFPSEDSDDSDLLSLPLEAAYSRKRPSLKTIRDGMEMSDDSGSDKSYK